MVKIGLKHDTRGRELWYRDGKRVAGGEIPIAVRRAAGSFGADDPSNYCLYRSGDKTFENACKTSKAPLQQALIREILNFPALEFDDKLDVVMQSKKVDIKSQQFKATWVYFMDINRFGLRAVVQKNVHGQYRLLLIFDKRAAPQGDVRTWIDFITGKPGIGNDRLGDAMELLGDANFKRLSAREREQYVARVFPD